MNKVILCGRLTRDPDIRRKESDNSQEKICIARYTLAVNRRQQDDKADFPSIIAFGRAGEFAEKYLHKGTKIIVTGRIQTGSYTNKDGARVYTTDIVVEDQEFAESKAAGEGSKQGNADEPCQQEAEEGFMRIPDGIDEELPFS